MLCQPKKYAPYLYRHALVIFVATLRCRCCTREPLSSCLGPCDPHLILIYMYISCSLAVLLEYPLPASFSYVCALLPSMLFGRKFKCFKRSSIRCTPLNFTASLHVTFNMTNDARTRIDPPKFRLPFHPTQVARQENAYTYTYIHISQKRKCPVGKRLFIIIIINYIRLITASS